MQDTVLIDGLNLALRKGTGIATYGRNLSQSLHDLDYKVDILYGAKAGASSNPALREISFFDGMDAKRSWQDELNVASQLSQSLFGRTAKPIPISGHVITKPLGLPFFDQVWNVPYLFDVADTLFHIYSNWLNVRIPTPPSIAHWTSPVPIKVPGAKNIYTIHDLIPLRLPYTTLDNKRTYYRLISGVLKRAKLVLTVSETSKKDICNLFDYPEDKIVNTYQPVRIPQHLLEKPESVVRREIEGGFNLKYKNYFLFFGAIEPKKNVGRLIEAYLGANVAAPLVVLGEKAWKWEGELRPTKNSSIRYFEQIENQVFTRDRVLRVDYAPYPILVSLIRGAKAVLFPSLYEGFGLPVVESMLLGTPVLSSTEGAIPEVSGDAALLVDPYDIQAIAEGIRALDTDADLASNLRVKGLKRAERFGPDRFNARLAQAYGQI
jgi:glycosyltransferase involved in cell wall biosynthesis